MADLIIDDEELAQQIRDIAEQEQRPVKAVLRSMISSYAVQPSSSKEIDDMLDAYHARAAEVGPLEAMLGMFDDDITDLSSITKEDVWEAYRKKFSDTP
jgi:hypothetical protein